MRAVMIAAALTAVACVAAGMTYTDICEGSRCMKFSRLIIGTDHLGQVGEERLNQVINEALRLGINAIDTAPIYIDSEYFLSHYVPSHYLSGSSSGCPACPVRIITKGGFPYDLAPGTYRSRLVGSRSDITNKVKEELDGSLSRLGHVDLWLMHRDDFDSDNYALTVRERTPVSDILGALSDGAVRNNYGLLGVSNWRTERIAESQRVQGTVRPVANSPYFSLMAMNGEHTIHVGGVQVSHEDMMDMSFQPGVKIMSYSPLAGFSLFSRGWDAARQTALDLKNNNDRYWGHVFDAIFTEENHQRFIRAGQFAERYNREHGTSITIDQVANAWALAHPRLDHLIIGPRNLDALHRTIAAIEVAKNLTAADLHWLFYGDGDVPPVPPTPTPATINSVVDNQGRAGQRQQVQRSNPVATFTVRVSTTPFAGPNGQRPVDGVACHAYYSTVQNIGSGWSNIRDEAMTWSNSDGNGEIWKFSGRIDNGNALEATVYCTSTNQKVWLGRNFQFELVN
eukprot:m51a1_g1694 hypothetical protein (511) ;mRNA; f:477552-479414